MTDAPSPGEQIAAALRRSPIYVDPSLASAVPPAKRTELLARMRRSPIPIFVVIVPLVKGGTWHDPDQLTTVVHDRLRRDGAYLTLDDYDGQLAARQYGGTEESQRNTRSAAQVPFFLDELDDATLADRLLRAVDLIAAGRGRAEYEAATAHLGRSGALVRPPRRRTAGCRSSRSPRAVSRSPPSPGWSCGGAAAARRGGAGGCCLLCDRGGIRRIGRGGAGAVGADRDDVQHPPW